MPEEIGQLNEEVIKQIKEWVRGSRGSPAAISEPNKKACVHIEQWRNHPPAGRQKVYEHEAPGGCPGGRLCCGLASFSRDLQTNLLINLDGTRIMA